MNPKKSKVTRCEFKKEYTGKYGTIFYFDIEMENGDQGQYGSKSQNQTKFAVGKEVEYTIEPGNLEGTFKIKPFTPKPGDKGFTPKGGYMSAEAQISESRRAALKIAIFLENKIVEGANYHLRKWRSVKNIYSWLTKSGFDTPEAIRDCINRRHAMELLMTEYDLNVNGFKSELSGIDSESTTNYDNASKAFAEKSQIFLKYLNDGQF